MVYMKEADMGSFGELVSRYAIIGAATAALYFANMSAIFLIWAAIYFGSNLLYVILLSRSPDDVSASKFSFFIVLNMISTTAFAALPIYLWTFDSLALKALALCGVGGNAMFVLWRHVQMTPNTFWEIILIAGSILFLGISTAVGSQNLSEMVIILTGTFGVALYYTFAHLSTIATHQNLIKARQTMAQSQKMEAIGRLTGGVAHDFNNILTIVKGNLELYRELETVSEKDAVVQEAHDASDRAVKVIAQLMAFSRQSTLQPRDIDLENLFGDLNQFLRPALPENIALTTLFPARKMSVWADPDQLSSAVLNLALNARDAMPEGGRIKVHVAPADDTSVVMGDPLSRGTYTKIAVSDTGTGISTKDLYRVSDPFFTTKPTGKGSGLGLSMVRGFVEQSHGGLAIESTAGRGTTVSLLLPSSKRIEAGPMPHDA